jgi:hypothetical protein
MRQVPAPISDDGELIAACGYLQTVYRKSRYEPEPIPTAEEARNASEAARVARNRLLKELERQRYG